MQFCHFLIKYLPQYAPIIKRPKIIISNDLLIFDSAIKPPPMNARRLLMSMAFLLLKDTIYNHIKPRIFFRHL